MRGAAHQQFGSHEYRSTQCQLYKTDELCVHSNKWGPHWPTGARERDERVSYSERSYLADESGRSQPDRRKDESHRAIGCWFPRRQPTTALSCCDCWSPRKGQTGISARIRRLSPMVGRTVSSTPPRPTTASRTPTTIDGESRRAETRSCQRPLGPGRRTGNILHQGQLTRLTFHWTRG